jgi:hypothetical protein
LDKTKANLSVSFSCLVILRSPLFQKKNLLIFLLLESLFRNSSGFLYIAS